MHGNQAIVVFPYFFFFMVALFWTLTCQTPVLYSVIFKTFLFTRVLFILPWFPSVQNTVCDTCSIYSLCSFFYCIYYTNNTFYNIQLKKTNLCNKTDIWKSAYMCFTVFNKYWNSDVLPALFIRDTLWTLTSRPTNLQLYTKQWSLLHKDCCKQLLYIHPDLTRPERNVLKQYYKKLPASMTEHFNCTSSPPPPQSHLLCSY